MTDKPTKPDATGRASRFLPLPPVLEAALWGVVAYLVVRVTPVLVVALTGWPVVLENHPGAMGFALGVFAGTWGCLRDTRTKTETQQ